MAPSPQMLPCKHYVTSPESERVSLVIRIITDCCNESIDRECLEEQRFDYNDPSIQSMKIIKLNGKKEIFL